MMKTTALLTRLSIILFIKITHGQQNFVYNEHFEPNGPALQEQSTYGAINSIQEFLNHNGNTAPNDINQQQLLIPTIMPTSSPCTQRIQLPPDLQTQPLQVQQYLQLQQSLQPSLPLERALELQPQPHLQPHLQLQQPLQIEIEAQPLKSIISQDILQSQPQIQLQPQLPSHYPLQSCQAEQNLQRSQLQPPIQSQQIPLPLQLQFQQASQPYDSLQATHSINFQQPLGSQQVFPQNPLALSDRTNLVEPLVPQLHNNHPKSEIHVKWKSTDLPGVSNFENPRHIQLQNIEHQQNSVIRPVEAIVNGPNGNDKPRDVSSLRYYYLSQQPSPPSALTASAPVVSSSPIATIPSNYISPIEETYVPVIAPYKYVIPNSEIQLSVPEIAKSVRSTPPTPAIIAIPSSTGPKTSAQLHYYNQQTPNSRQTAYINQNSGFWYPEQSQLSVGLQSQPSASVSNQAIVSSVPISVVQVPAISPQYSVSTGYPLNTITAPVYTSYKPKSSNLKSILPLIFDLLKAKITSCGCNDCPCECKNNNKNNQLEVASGYSSQKDYSPFEIDDISVLNAISEESQSPGCLRGPKNCEKINKTSTEASSETLDEELSEEEIDEDEDSC